MVRSRLPIFSSCRGLCNLFAECAIPLVICSCNLTTVAPISCSVITLMSNSNLTAVLLIQSVLATYGCVWSQIGGHLAAAARRLPVQI